MSVTSRSILFRCRREGRRPERQDFEIVLWSSVASRSADVMSFPLRPALPVTHPRRETNERPEALVGSLERIAESPPNGVHGGRSVEAETPVVDRASQATGIGVAVEGVWTRGRSCLGVRRLSARHDGLPR